MSLETVLVEAFKARYDRIPDGVYAAPGRVNLIGEHTDYNEGLCLPIALPQRTFAAIGRRDDDVLRLASLDLDGEETIDLGEVGPGVPQGWASYVAGVLWALREGGYEVGGIDCVITSQVPIGAGLSSSAALEGAVGVGVSELFNLGLTASDDGRARLATACQRAENEIAQAPTGGLDQAASLRTAPGHAILLDCRDGSIEQIPFDLARHGLELLVMNTRADHALVDGQYGERRASCEQAARELGVTSLREVDPAELDDALARLSSDLLRRRARHVVTEIERVREVVAALRADDFAQVGRLFDASHASMRDDFEISCPELDTACAVAVAEGALGARMTGGGFGGSAIALVPAGRGDAIGLAVTDAFADAGYVHAPQNVVVVAGGPGERVG